MARKGNVEVRRKWVTIRVNEAEYKCLQSLYKQSTSRGISEYLRDVILQKPITIKYRNEASDEILSAFLKTKTELNAIGNNLNQAVHKLHMLDRIPEYRTWITTYENIWQTLDKSLLEIKERMDQFYRRWSQK